MNLIIADILRQLVSLTVGTGSQIGSEMVAKIDAWEAAQEETADIAATSQPVPVQESKETENPSE